MRLPIVVTALGCLLGACVGTETGNPTFTGQLSYNTFSTQPAVAALRASEGGIQVDSAWLVLGDVSFVSESQCDRPELAPVHAHGLGAGDHARPVAPSTPFELGSGRYCALRLPFLRSDGPTTPDVPVELAGHSILIELTLPDGTDARIESDFEGAVSLAALSDGFDMDAQHADLLVAFDVATWLDGIGLDQAQGSEGVFVVNATEHSDVLAAFEARLAAGIALYRDPQESGQVEADSERIAEGE